MFIYITRDPCVRSAILLSCASLELIIILIYIIVTYFLIMCYHTPTFLIVVCLFPNSYSSLLSYLAVITKKLCIIFVVVPFFTDHIVKLFSVIIYILDSNNIQSVSYTVLTKASKRSILLFFSSSFLSSYSSLFLSLC